MSAVSTFSEASPELCVLEEIMIIWLCDGLDAQVLRNERGIE
jgi:hypothetical protein